MGRLRLEVGAGSFVRGGAGCLRAGPDFQFKDLDELDTAFFAGAFGADILRSAPDL